MELDFESTENITKAIFGDRIPTQEEQEAAISAIKGIIRYKLMHTNVSVDSIDIPSLIEDAKSLYPVLLETNAFIINRFPHFTLNEADIVTSLTVLTYIKETDKKQISIIDYINSISDKIEVFIEVLRERTPKEVRTQQIESLIATSHIMPNNKLMYDITHKNIINTGPYDMGVINKTNRRREITSYTVITYNEEGNDTGIKISPFNLTEYERQVSDAVISLWVEAEKQCKPCIITTDMIYRAMPGGGDKPSPQRRGAITRAVDKLRGIKIYVDATEEMRKRKVAKENEEIELDDYYLSAFRVKLPIKNGGQCVYAYRINAEPIVYQYARMTKQVLSVNAKHIEIKKVKGGKISDESISMTEGRISMTGYMLRRILVMKHAIKNKDTKQSHTILFETIFNDTGIDTSNRRKNQLNRDFCFEVLDYWKASGLIAGYAIQKKGASITGVEILFNGPALKPGKQ